MEINLFEVQSRLKNSFYKLLWHKAVKPLGLAKDHRKFKTRLSSKTIFLMKLSTFLYLVFTFQLFAFNGFSQKNVTLKEENSSLKSILSQIEEQTSYVFILNNDEINVNQNFSINASEQKVADAIALLFKNVSISYKIKKKHIILSKKKDAGFTISGVVTDANTGETLLGANVIIKKSSKGVVTNEYGFYSITLPKGTYTFEVSYLGYKSREIEVLLESNKSIKIELEPSSRELEEVTIHSNKDKSQVKSILGGTSSITTSEIKKLPALLGEPDITRAILTLPGISSVGEGTSGFNARGGNVDQNLILLDDAPLYNSSHLFGLFSIFNADAIKVVKLYNGEIPARYGGRASSVLDIRQKNGNTKRFKGEGGIGLLFSKFTLEGPIKKDKLSFLASGRRSYFDLFFPLFDDISFNKFHFYDLNTKLTWDINEKNKLFASGFFGADVILFDQNNNSNVIVDSGWTNTTGTLRWNHVFSDKLFANITGIYSKYNFGLGAQEITEEQKIEGNLDRSIKNWIFKPDFSYYPNLNTTMKFGLATNLYLFNPELNVPGVDKTLNKEKALELAAYYSLEKHWDKLSIQTGLRFSWFANFGEAEIPIYDANFPQSPNTIIGYTNFENNEISKSFFGIEPRLYNKPDHKLT